MHQRPANALGIWLAIYFAFIVGYKRRTWPVRPVPPAFYVVVLLLFFSWPSFFLWPFPCDPFSFPGPPGGGVVLGSGLWGDGHFTGRARCCKNAPGPTGVATDGPFSDFRHCGDGPWGCHWHRYNLIANNSVLNLKHR